MWNGAAAGPAHTGCMSAQTLGQEQKSMLFAKQQGQCRAKASEPKCQWPGLPSHSPRGQHTHTSKVSYTSPGRDFFRRDEKGQQIATREASMRESL